MPCLFSMIPWPALVVVLAGCTGTKHPEIAVTGATIDQTTEHAATIRLALRLENPNNEPLQLLEFDYRVSVDGRQAYRGKRSAEMTLARQSVRDVEIPAVIVAPADDAGGAATLAETAFQVHGTLRYLAPGAIEQTLFDTGVRRPRVNFSGSGRLAPGALTETAQAAHDR